MIGLILENLRKSSSTSSIILSTGSPMLIVWRSTTNWFIVCFCPYDFNLPHISCPNLYRKQKSKSIVCVASLKPPTITLTFHFLEVSILWKMANDTFFQGQMCQISRANVSHINGKCVKIVKGKCANGKWYTIKLTRAVGWKGQVNFTPLEIGIWPKKKS